MAPSAWSIQPGDGSMGAPAKLGDVGVAAKSAAQQPQQQQPPAPEVEPNLVGMFAGDWATEDKVALLAESYTIYSSLQKIAAEQRNLLAPSALADRSIPPPQTLQYFHRISGLYRDALRRYLSHLEAALQGKRDTEDEDEDEGEEGPADGGAGRRRREGGTLASAEQVPLPSDLEHVQLLHTVCHLSETLYLPSDGRGTGVVGEEILHWLNSFDLAPRTEEGQEIAEAAVPYQHPSYWDYILRCVLRGFHSAAAAVLQALASHPSRSLRSVASRVAQLLSSLPRSTRFSLESDFVAAHRRWLTSVRAALIGLERDLDEMEAEMADLATKQNEGGDSTASAAAAVGSREEVEDERLEFEAQFRCLLELMAGVRDRVFEACEDWKEALGAWGTLVQPAMKRDDLPEIMTVIMAQFPSGDDTKAGEKLQCALARGEVVAACRMAEGVDPWLAVHLTDLFTKIGLLRDEFEAAGTSPGESGSLFAAKDAKIKNGKGAPSPDEAALTLRDGMVRRYAETLLDDQGLWRLSLDYLATARNTPASSRSSRRRMREVILDVPLLGDEARPSRARPASLEELEREAREAEMDEDELNPDEARRERRRRQREARKRAKINDEFERVEEVLRACVEHGLELEARAICKQLAIQTAKERRYGVAVSYCVRAGDVRQVKRIADQLLEEYVSRGAEEFCRLVDAIPTSLLEGRAALPPRHGEDAGDRNSMSVDGEGDDEDGMHDVEERGRDAKAEATAMGEGAFGVERSLFSSRLTFVARYRDFHALYAQGQLAAAATLLVQLLESNIAPGPFWAVMLVDAIPLLEGADDLFTLQQTFELLRILEQITASIELHEAEAAYYLGPLERLLSGGGASTSGETETGTGTRDPRRLKQAMRRMDVVRFGLARQLARSSIANVDTV